MADTCTSSESSPGTILGTSYRMTRAICLDDVRSKFLNHEVVRSDDSFCQYDPHPTSFHLRTVFGRGDDNGFHCALFPSKEVTLVFMEITIFDDRGQMLFTRNYPEKIKLPTTGLEFQNLHIFDASSTYASSWRMVFVQEYMAGSLTPVGSSNTASPKLRLQEEFRHLLDSEDQSDVTFVVQGEKIAAHKVILTTRSEYFRSMFDCGMVESVTNGVVVPDVKPKGFRDLLRFIYTNVAPKYEGKSTMELLSAADKYGVDDLKKMCETAIGSHLNARTVIDALLLAEKHNCPTLMASAKAVFGSHASTLKSKEEWNKLNESPTLPLELLKHCY